MQKTEVAGAAVAFGQEVLQDEMQKCYTAESADFSLPGLAVFVTERDVAIAIASGQNFFFLYHAPIQITPEVNQRVLA